MAKEKDVVDALTRIMNSPDTSDGLKMFVAKVILGLGWNDKPVQEEPKRNK